MAHVAASVRAMVDIDCAIERLIPGSPTVPLPAQNSPVASRPPVSRTTMAVFALAVAGLCALNMIHAYQLGLQSRMYDNPIYRWRQSLVIALSRMQPQPLHGYVGYRSILTDLTRNGLALMGGEEGPNLNNAERAALLADGPRMDRLMQEASRVAIDPALPPVILQENELGLVDYMYWAFRLYGISTNALTLFYFTLLFVSVALFVVTFRRCRFCLLLLMLYLAGHYFVVDYAQFRGIQTIHNSRFLPVIALLPSLHLILLMATKVPPRPGVLAMAAVQTFILMFIVFCRAQAYWQIAAIAFAAVAVSGLRPIRQALIRRKRWLAALAATARETWPAVLAVLGVVVLLGYSRFAPDPSLYSSESKTHLLWHGLFISTVNSDAELTALYTYNARNDSIGYTAATHDLRGRNDVTSPIAVEADGVLNIDILKSSDAYDLEMRRLFFRVVREHPWLVLHAFAVGRFARQIEMYDNVPQLTKLDNYLVPALLALAATLLALTFGAAPPDRSTTMLAARFLLVVLASSLITNMFDASPVIVDVLLTWLAAALLCAVYVPVAVLFGVWRRSGAGRRLTAGQAATR
jgi:hypothetical protein